MTDVNQAPTSYTYGACGNSFVTQVSLPVNNLSRAMTWDCTGGVMKTATDENSQVTTWAYNDPNYWRPTSITDPTQAVTNLSYCPTNSSPPCADSNNPIALESALNFNGTNSTVDSRSTLDGLGRLRINQTKQSPTSLTYDSVETDYDAFGRPSAVTVPYNGSVGQYASQTGSTVPSTSITYDALSRLSTVQDGGGGTTNYTWNQNDVLVDVAGTPKNDRELEYDALGRLTSVCEVTTLTGSASCGQNTAVSGFLTKYTYNLLDKLNGVTQNTQPSANPQTRTYTYDGLGRMLSETNPETGQVNYTYDTDTACGVTSNGDLVKRVDAGNNVTCYAYDAMHRLTDVTYLTVVLPFVTPPSRHFVYDVATVNGQTMNNAGNRLAEAYTGTITAKMTDLGFSYTSRGEISDVYESTPNSGGYYHMRATYATNGPFGLMATLNPNITGLPTWSYTPDGEGRAKVINDGGQNLLNGVSYNVFSEPYAVNFGSLDSDAFSYDPNTGRMTQYQYDVFGTPLTGTPTWNANGTLASLSISDTFNLLNAQSCAYSYEDLARLNKVDCGTGNWGQGFGYDAFGNITKSVLPGDTGQPFNPGYVQGNGLTTNRYVSLPSTTPGYDNNGNLTSDGFHTYNWDAENRMQQLDSGPSWIFDALGRWVEKSSGGNTEQAVYAPQGPAKQPGRRDIHRFRISGQSAGPVGFPRARVSRDPRPLDPARPGRNGGSGPDRSADLESVRVCEE